MKKNHEIVPNDNPNVQSDYDYSRSTYYELIEKGKESLELMIEVARESEHPRAFEVLSNMIKGIADVNDKLMALNKITKEVKQDKAKEQLAVTNNNVFIGSTSELQKLLIKEREKDITPNE